MLCSWISLPWRGRPGRTRSTLSQGFDEIRKTFAATHEAKLRNYDAGKFSFNVEGGRCNACQGDGFLTIDMQFLPDVMIRCPECRGTRYRPEILEITYRGRNIAEVLDLTAREAFVFFRHRPKVQSRLRPMLDIGLDYLRLGQPVSTLSGGEAQRLKLAGFLGRSHGGALSRRPHARTPSSCSTSRPPGLHPVDVVKLLEALNALVDRGHSLIVIEHSPELMVSRRLDHRPRPRRRRRRRPASWRRERPKTWRNPQSPTGQVLAKHCTWTADQGRRLPSRGSAASRSHDASDPVPCSRVG